MAEPGPVWSLSGSGGIAAAARSGAERLKGVSKSYEQSLTLVAFESDRGQSRPGRRHPRRNPTCMEKAKAKKEAHGEFGSEHPGYCGAQDTFYVGNIKEGGASKPSSTPTRHWRRSHVPTMFGLRPGHVFDGRATVGSPAPACSHIRSQLRGRLQPPEESARRNERPANSR